MPINTATGLGIPGGRLLATTPGAADLDLGFRAGAGAAQAVGDAAGLFAFIDGDAAGVGGIAIAPAVGGAFAGRGEEDQQRSGGVAVGSGAVVVLEDKTKIIRFIVDSARVTDCQRGQDAGR